MNTSTLGISAEEGLDLSGVVFRYTPVKNVIDDFSVTIEADKVGGGYIFQETDDWSGKYGIKIQKVIPFGYTPVEQFGESRIRTTGVGTVEDASVVYMYRWDACRIPTDPACPNYVPPIPELPKIDIYDALEDEFVAQATQETDRELLEEDETKELDDEEDENERLEVALATTENALTIANAVSQAVLLQVINKATNINAYYDARIPSTIYKDTITLQDKDIVDNRLVLRSLSQEQLMNEMIEEQYK
tara:strand:- start:352 stop:1092 length:741 start_codon:yes stop_codon:yes gene_type:complete